VTYGTSGGTFAEIDPRTAAERNVRVTNLLEGGPPPAAVSQAALVEALDLAAARRIRPVIGATYPLARARDAHDSLARRATVGKSLLVV
jgi:NADPH2:quinone reductase